MHNLEHNLNAKYKHPTLARFHVQQTEPHGKQEIIGVHVLQQ